MRNRNKWIVIILPIMLLLAGCNLPKESSSDSTDNGSDDLYTVTRVIDGDTIEVRQGEVTYRVRYVGVNTPESDESCFQDATQANRNLVDGQQVRLERDDSNTDRYGRLLRFIYVGTTFVNETLVRDGWAEAVLYPPDDGYHDRLVDLEEEASSGGRGCHPTGIFNDGSSTR
ncbi:MAG: thermonuclease family protein [Anaerolineae bacterium]|nr:thermonuclease family protein [Anaerolineae bacterium]